jgi:hypothetical protein
MRYGLFNEKIYWHTYAPVRKKNIGLLYKHESFDQNQNKGTYGKNPPRKNDDSE